eukprot:1222819-Pleurochrysis_carterae.AAC.3
MQHVAAVRSLPTAHDATDAPTAPRGTTDRLAAGARTAAMMGYILTPAVQLSALLCCRTFQQYKRVIVVVE